MKRGAFLRIVLFACLWAAPAAAVDLTYEGEDGPLIYRFEPRTGTLNDLQVICADGFTFYPAFHGGITSFELGGKRLKPWHNLHTTRLVHEVRTQDFYQAHFNWSFNGEELDILIDLQLRGRTLVIQTKALGPPGQVVEFGPDRSEDTPDPKVVVLPFGHNVLWSNNVFISAVIDPSLSAASSIRPLNAIHSAASAYYSDLASYAPRTGGLRNRLNETIFLTVSSRIEETFVSFSNPVSPYREFLSDKIVLGLWRTSFSRAQTDIETLAGWGMTGLLVVLHYWQKYGYDDGYPTTYPAGNIFGGPSGLSRISRLCRDCGYGLALHTNYVDFYPDSDVWQPADIALSSGGNWVTSWYNPTTGIQSFLMKPGRAVDYARLYEPSIHGDYLTTAGYLDVHSAILPSFRVDFDARAIGAGQQRLTFEAYRDLFGYLRSVHQGPVLGEGYGYAAPVWAGHIDALEGDPRSLFDIELGREGSQVPILVDYKLRVLHGLFVLHGAGYYERFYHDPSPLTDEKLERYRATELAFGMAGFLSNPFVHGLSKTDILREYCFLKHLQSYYLTAEVSDISYWVDGELMTASAALNRILPSVSNAGVNDALLERLAKVRVLYDNGFILCVNRSSSSSWERSENGSSYSLPPGGFLGLLPGEFVAYTAIVQGVKRYVIWPAEPPCLGSLDNGS